MAEDTVLIDQWRVDQETGELSWHYRGSQEDRHCITKGDNSILRSNQGYAGGYCDACRWRNLADILSITVRIAGLSHRTPPYHYPADKGADKGHNMTMPTSNPYQFYPVTYDNR
jgi:hypothetical protein